MNKNIVMVVLFLLWLLPVGTARCWSCMNVDVGYNTVDYGSWGSYPRSWDTVYYNNNSYPVF